MAFTIVINLYAKDGKDVEEQLRAKLIEASQAFSKHDGIIGWYPLQNTTDSRKWTVITRCEQESILDQHRELPESKAFMEALLPLLENGKDSVDPQVSKELL
ncbi:hypothetical protein PRIC1_007185 [Phytophthora ramorum]|uniref:ABM domain-containing protein n=1 Tax=Phytophthora ramorum TaxID=164328 RepID=H3GTU4_PHYRM|nr:hypothetical protein KRP23_2642 [Phytophthora ramorum]KAH7488698.1 hypothetical protein KRP23_2643 [Phytophthora ramorum]KAH7502022.1 hypothetical protein KRP22_7496 [Phytophthora ramorum]KAH7502023.1 hypothetical protein KRP22_7497 [Phytophthora ramorum]